MVEGEHSEDGHRVVKRGLECETSDNHLVRDKRLVEYNFDEKDRETKSQCSL